MIDEDRSTWTLGQLADEVIKACELPMGCRGTIIAALADAKAQGRDESKSGGGISPDTAELVLTTMRNVADYLEANMDSAPEDDEYDWLRTPIMALRTAIARFEPPKSGGSDAKDAARWRYVRDFIGREDILYWEREEQAGARADAEISAETDAETDAAILRREGHKPGTVDPSLTPEVIRKEAEAGAWNPKPPSAGGDSGHSINARHVAGVSGLPARADSVPTSAVGVAHEGECGSNPPDALLTPHRERDIVLAVPSVRLSREKTGDQ